MKRTCTIYSSRVSLSLAIRAIILPSKRFFPCDDRTRDSRLARFLMKYFLATQGVIYESHANATASHERHLRSGVEQGTARNQFRTRDIISFNLNLRERETPIWS